MTDVIIELDLERVELRNRLRPVSEADMLAVAASFAERGQDQPIIVRDMGEQSDGVRLVAGAHRVCAARYLGWETIKAIVRQMSDEEALLAEIDENLIRRELTILDRAIALKQRREAYLKAHPEAARGKAKKPKDGKSLNLSDFTSFGEDAAKKTGLSLQTINRAVHMLESLDPAAIEALRLSPVADNQAQLFALADLEPEAQRTVAAALGAGIAGNVKAAQIATKLLPETRLDPQEQIVTRFTALAERASPETLRFMAEHAKAMLAKKRAKPVASQDGDDA